MVDLRRLLRRINPTCARRVDGVEFHGGFEKEEGEGGRGEEGIVDGMREGREVGRLPLKSEE